MIGVMNNTKWDELRLAMYGIDKFHPRWRTKDRENAYISEWDGEWFYHFPAGGYFSIEWVDIEANSSEQREIISAHLKRIHVPGVETVEGFRVFGWIAEGEPTSYL